MRRIKATRCCCSVPFPFLKHVQLRDNNGRRGQRVATNSGSQLDSSVDTKGVEKARSRRCDCHNRLVSAQTGFCFIQQAL